MQLNYKCFNCLVLYNWGPIRNDVTHLKTVLDLTFVYVISYSYGVNVIKES